MITLDLKKERKKTQKEMENENIFPRKKQSHDHFTTTISLTFSV